MSDQPPNSADQIQPTYFPGEQKKTLERADLRNLNFTNINSKGRRLENCDLSYSTFERGYFRDAVFIHCKFVGCRFYDCNFRGAKFIQCDFDYADFSRSLVDHRDIVSTLPTPPNLRRDLLQNLRANATSIGDYESARIYIIEEMAASTEHFRRGVVGYDDYYLGKFNTLMKRLGALWNFVWLNFDDFIWGHGEKPAKIFVSATLMLSVMALINMPDISSRGVSLEESLWGLRSLEYVGRLFLDISPDQRFRGFVMIDYAIAIFRFIFFGIAASLLVKIASHR